LSISTKKGKLFSISNQAAFTKHSNPDLLQFKKQEEAVKIRLTLVQRKNPFEGPKQKPAIPKARSMSEYKEQLL
jgi:hypothetical protein